MIQFTLPLKKPTIFCDRREKKLIALLKEFKDLEVKISDLKVGDFLLSSNLVVERKSWKDFVKSILDGRIFEQAELMKDNYKKVVFVIEGFGPFKNIQINLLFSIIASLLSNFNTSIFVGRNEFDTARLLYWLAKSEFTKLKNLGSVPKKKPKELEEIKKFVLSSFPGISTKTSTKLLQNFKTLKEVFNASFYELKKVLGEQKAKKFLKILNS